MTSIYEFLLEEACKIQHALSGLLLHNRLAHTSKFLHIKFMKYDYDVLP